MQTPVSENRQRDTEPWFVRVINDKGREVLLSALTFVLFLLIVAIRHYFTGKTFEWESISPIEAPGLLPRMFYSALVFIGPGWFLYHKLKFWKFLYEPYRGGGRAAYREYKKLKAFVWVSLILIMYFIIVPSIVDLLNAIISFFYNLFILVLYLIPPLAITTLLYGIYRIARRN
jgi:hypothetical protein